MQKLVVAVSLMALLAIGTVASADGAGQGWRFDTLSVTSGQDALASGLAGFLRVKNGKVFMEVVVQQEQGWFNGGRSFQYRSLKVDLAASAGHAFGEFWVGPYGYAEVPLATVGGRALTVSTLQWPLVFAQEPERWRNDGRQNAEPLPWALYSDASLSWGPVGVTYSYLDFLDDELVRCLGVALGPKLGKDFKLKFSATYNFRTEKMMYLLGVSWSPNS